MQLYCKSVGLPPQDHKTGRELDRPVFVFGSNQSDNRVGLLLSKACMPTAVESSSLFTRSTRIHQFQSEQYNVSFSAFSGAASSATVVTSALPPSPSCALCATSFAGTICQSTKAIFPPSVSLFEGTHEVEPTQAQEEHDRSLAMDKMPQESCLNGTRTLEFGGR